MSLRGLAFGLICAAWLLFTPVALFMAMMSIMALDAGRSGGGVALMINFFTWPVGTSLGPVAAGVAWHKGLRKLAWMLAAAPLLWLLLPVLVWIGAVPLGPA